MTSGYLSEVLPGSASTQAPGKPRALEQGAGEGRGGVPTFPPGEKRGCRAAPITLSLQKYCWGALSRAWKSGLELPAPPNCPPQSPSPASRSYLSRFRPVVDLKGV